MPRARALALTSLVAAAAGLLSPASASGACEQILISASRGQGAKGAARLATAAAGTIRPRTYAASGIEDLAFRVRSKELPVGALLELRVELPGGHHYQTLAAPLAGETLDAGPDTGGTDTKVRRVDGYPFPLAVAVPRRVATGAASGNGWLEVAFTLPVAGTAIVSNSLYGEWRVVPVLDGKVCGAPLVFALDP